MIWSLLLVFAVGYLLGSVNFSIFITRLVGGYDIRSRGSGNAGSTNVARNLGVWWGVLTVLCEVIKNSSLGLLIKYGIPSLQAYDVSARTAFALIAVWGCLLGNMFPVFHGFKGGKGVTVALAAALIVDWKLFVVFLGVFFICLALTKYVSVSSMVSCLALCVGTCFLLKETTYVWACVAEAAVCAGVIVYNHRSNIKRLLNGNENRFSVKKG